MEQEVENLDYFEGQYLDYSDYRLLGGTLNQMPFNLLEFNARKEIDGRTQNRLANIEEIPNEVKLCVFEMINTINGYSNNEESSNKLIASESTDGYSVSYASSTQIAEIIKSKNVELENIMRTYLLNVIVDGTPLLYLGVK